MRQRTAVIVLGATLATGATVGYFSGAGQHPVEYRTIEVHTPPQVITHVEEKEVVKTTPLPDSCKSLVELSKESFTYDQTISAAAGKINQAIFDGVAQLAGGEPAKWVQTEQDIYDAQKVMNEALTSKGDLQESINRQQEQCDRALQNPK